MVASAPNVTDSKFQSAVQITGSLKFGGAELGRRSYWRFQSAVQITGSLKPSTDVLLTSPEWFQSAVQITGSLKAVTT